MKLGQLTEYDMRNIFLEKPYTKCGVETSPRPFAKISKLSISLDQKSKVCIQFVSIVCQVGDYQNILKLSYRLLAFISYNIFYKSKKRSGTSLPASFSA